MAPLSIDASHQWRLAMTRLPIALALASLVVVNSTIGAAAAVAAIPVHASIVRHAAAPQVYRRESPPIAGAMKPHDQNPFADLLLG
jgi:hypothetical protein